MEKVRRLKRIVRLIRIFDLLYVRTVLMDELLKNKIAIIANHHNKSPFLWNWQITCIWYSTPVLCMHACVCVSYFYYRVHEFFIYEASDAESDIKAIVCACVCEASFLQCARNTRGETEWKIEIRTQKKKKNRKLMYNAKRIFTSICVYM